MKSRVLKSVASALLAIIFILTPTGFLSAEQNNATKDTNNSRTGADITTKNEVIYGNLALDGSVHALYTVNHFELTKPGMITDYGNYQSVVNLTDTTPITLSEDTITVQTDSDNFYYQGNMAVTELPWLFDISYYMDGEKIPPKDIAGSSGELKIQILTSQNSRLDPVFYDHYMLQISMTMDTDRCRNINSPGATIASAGKNKIITHTVMPKSEGNIQVQAFVEDFTMAGIEISAVPFTMNMNLPETDDLIEEFSQLPGAISDLNEGVGKLTEGTEGLLAGASKLENGSSDVKAGLAKLSNNSGQLTGVSAQINSSLAQIASSLGKGIPEDMNLEDISMLPQGLAQLAQGLEEISGGLDKLKNGFTTAYSALDAAISEIPDASLTEEQLQVLYTKTDPSQQQILNQLTASYKAAQIVKGTYNQVKSAFDAVGSTIDTLAGSIDLIAGQLNEISGGIADALSGSDVMAQMQQLSLGLSELSANYTKFHNGLVSYMDGVGSLAAGYPQFHSGISAFADGIEELNKGVEEMYTGTSQFNDEAKDMPGKMQSEIDRLMEQYTGSDFTPVSFTSPKNTTTGFVQFVLKCEGIEKEQPEEVSEAEPVKETFWDRLTALFE